MESTVETPAGATFSLGYAVSHRVITRRSKAANKFSRVLVYRSGIHDDARKTRTGGKISIGGHGGGHSPSASMRSVASSQRFLKRNGGVARSRRACLVLSNQSKRVSTTADEFPSPRCIGYKINDSREIAKQ